MVQSSAFGARFFEQKENAGVFGKPCSEYTGVYLQLKSAAYIKNKITFVSTINTISTIPPTFVQRAKISS